jgi:ribosomal protein S18 acetylase RimI-like enzyme
MSEIQIRPLSASLEIVARLSEILVETVAHGGSVSFMHPLDRAVAAAFWQGALNVAGRGERIILGAFDGGALVGTMTLIMDLPPNQPHRAEIAKMMTHPSHRGRGAATALMREAEILAGLCGRTLLTLDTAAEDGASSLYEKLGFTFAGEIPDYALKPHGGLTATRIYWKRIGGAR